MVPGLKTEAAPIFPLDPTYTGPIVIKYFNFDVGASYSKDAAKTYPLTGETAVNGNTQNRAGLPDPNEDSWGIFKVRDIETPAGKVLFQDSAAAEITGIIYGEHDTYLKFDDPAPGVQVIRGTGLKIVFFFDTSPDFNPLPGPSARVGATPVYPTATDGEPILTGHSVPGFDASSADEFFSTFSPSAPLPLTNFNAVGGAAIELAADTTFGTGTMNSQFAIAGADMRVTFTGQNSAIPGWQIRSDDPVTATAVPTPAGLIWMTGALLGLVRPPRSLRRRKAE